MMDKQKAEITEATGRNSMEKLGSGTDQTRHGRMIAAWADDIHTRQLCDMTHIFIMIYESKLPLF